MKLQKINDANLLIMIIGMAFKLIGTFRLMKSPFYSVSFAHDPHRNTVGIVVLIFNAECTNHERLAKAG